jgi:hypothetical protein
MTARFVCTRLMLGANIVLRNMPACAIRGAFIYMWQRHNLKGM